MSCWIQVGRFQVYLHFGFGSWLLAAEEDMQDQDSLYNSQWPVPGVHNAKAEECTTARIPSRNIEI